MVEYHGARFIFTVNDHVVHFSKEELAIIAMACQVGKKSDACNAIRQAEGLHDGEAEQLVDKIEDMANEAVLKKLSGNTVSSPDGEVQTASGDGAVVARPHSVTTQGEGDAKRSD